MNRLLVAISAAFLIGSAVYFAAQSNAQQLAPEEPSPSPTIVVFNMPRVMKDYEKAKYHVAKLAEKRLSLATDVIKWRSDYVTLMSDHNKATDANNKEKLAEKLTDLSRRIQDREREIQKILNDDATKIIASIYDEIASVVNTIAEANGYQIVFTYPDVTTPVDADNPHFKEMKLKPTAALPFEVAAQSDITEEVIAVLNKRYPPKPID